MTLRIPGWGSHGAPTLITMRQDQRQRLEVAIEELAEVNKDLGFISDSDMARSTWIQRHQAAEDRVRELLDEVFK